MPTSASALRHAHAHAGVVPVTRRRRARAHTVSAANGSTATMMTVTPVNVPNQPRYPLDHAVSASVRPRDLPAGQSDFVDVPADVTVVRLYPAPCWMRWSS